MNKNGFALTTSYNRKGFDFFRTKVKLSKSKKVIKDEIAGKLVTFDTSNYIEYNAVWDTGASRSLIDKKIVKDLDLKPIGTATAQHYKDKKSTNVYKVDIIIPNTREKREAVIEDLKVAEEENFSGDVIIGMDLIQSFDIAITHTEEIINFSIRKPLNQTIDFELYRNEEK